MTEIRAKVVQFDLQPHPEADLLSIATIHGTGWQCVVRTSDIAEGSLGVYIPIDAEIEVSKPEFAFLAPKAKDGKFRIKTIRLRNRLSQDGLESGLTYMVGTHRTARNKDGNNLYSRISRELEVEKKLDDLLKQLDPKIHFLVFGEIYGFGVQDLHYGCGKNQQNFRVFDVLVDHVYQPWETVLQVAGALGVETVPLLHRGPFDLAQALRFRDGATMLGGAHVREGVVVVSEPETTHPEIGRKVIKFISDDYLLRKNATDGH